MLQLSIVCLCLIIAQCIFLGLFYALPASGSYVTNSSLRLVTYNTGLTTSVGQYEARRKEIGPALAELNADVMCLQEVWFSDDMEQLLRDLGPAVYSYSAIHAAVNQVAPVSRYSAPCMTSSFVFSFLPCFTWRCDVHSSYQASLLACAEQECGLLELDQQCVTCLMLAGRSSLFSRCFRNVGTQFNIPGLLLVSRRPLNNVRLAYYSNATLLLPRAHITAEVDGVGTVVCTHLTSDVGPTYYEKLPFGSWDSQNLNESRSLVTSLRHVQRTVVMGDTNSGPRIPHSDVYPSFEAGYNYFTGNVFDTPYVERVGVCTYCRYNPLADCTVGAILDHVFTRGLAVRGARRVLDRMTVEGRYSVSDHYGIEVTIATTD